MSKKESNKSSGTWLYVLLFLIAVASAAGVGFLIWSYQHNEVEMPEVTEAPQATPIPWIETDDKNEGPAEIEQDRELKFDHNIVGIPSKGVVSEDDIYDLFDEFKSLPVNYIEGYESDYGKVPTHSYINSDLILISGNDTFISNVDGSYIQLWLLESEGKIDDMINRLYDTYPGIKDIWQKHSGMFDYTAGVGLTDPSTWGLYVDEDHRDVTMTSAGVYQLVGMSHFDVSKRGYKNGFWYALLNNVTGEYELWAQVDIEDGLICQVYVQSSSDKNLYNHVAEIINNMLVVIK